MKLYKFEPKELYSLDGEKLSSPFTGYVELQIPTYKERLTLVKEVGMFDEKQAMNNLDKMFEIVESRVKEVKMKYGNEEFNSLDELSYYSEGSLIINECGKIILQGIPLGEK